MTKIEEMESMLPYIENTVTSILGNGIEIGNKEMFKLIINSLKDLHEENCKLWKAIAELQIGEMQKFHDKVFENNLEG